MDNRTSTAIFAGAILYVIVIALRYVQNDLTGPQLLLMLAAPAATGLLARGVKKGLTPSFAISLVMLTLEAVITLPGAFANPNVAVAIILMLLPFALISAALGAVGGLLGRRIFKK